MNRSIYEVPFYYEAAKNRISPVTKDLLRHIGAKVRKKYGRKFSGLWYVNQRDRDGGMRFIAQVETDDIIEKMSMRAYISDCIDFMTYGPVAGTMDLHSFFDAGSGCALIKGSEEKQWLHSGKIYRII